MELTHYEFVAHISKELGFFQSATAICFAKHDNATDIQVGDKGFLLEFSCYVNGGCSDGTKLSVALFASYLDTMLLVNYFKVDIISRVKYS